MIVFVYKYMFMNDYDFEYKISKLEEKYKREKQLNELKDKYGVKRRETNKILAIYLFTILNVVIIFSMVSMWVFADLSYLGVLITDIAAQIILYATYCLKAYHGKKQEEEMKYKYESNALHTDDDIEDPPDGECVHHG